MPQGKVIAIKPASLADDADLTQQQIQDTTCDGEVEILDGEYKGRIAYFEEHGKCCTKRVGEEVEVEIRGTGSGKLKAKFLRC